MKNQIKKYYIFQELQLLMETNWYNFPKTHKLWFDHGWGYLVKFLLMFIPMAFLLTLIHEGGHYLIASLFTECSGWEIRELHFEWFFWRNGYILLYIPPDKYIEWQFLLFLVAGSSSTLIVGFGLFWIVYHFDMTENIELFLTLYLTVFLLDLVTYLPVGIFLKLGDWYQIYIRQAWIVFVFSVIALLYVHLIIYYRTAIRKRINISEEYL